MSNSSGESEGFNEAAADRLGLSKAARELAQGKGLDPERGTAEAPDLSDEDRQRLAEDPALVDDVVARLSRKPTVLGKALHNEYIFVWAVGVVLVGVVAAWIFG